MPSIFSRLRGQSEGTSVSVESEVRIPWLTYLKDGIVSSIMTTVFWLTVWLLWFQIRFISRMSFGTWLNRYWRKSVSGYWPIVAISYLLCWGGLSAFLYRYRLGVEQGVKNPPLYENWKPDQGMWTPWVGWLRRRIERRGLRETYRKRFGKGSK